MRLYVGDDWAEEHHDVEIQDETGQRLVKARLPEGVAGIARLHELIAQLATGTDGEGDPQKVLVGIETDRGPWDTALGAAGNTVFADNPRQVARYRERHAMSGAKSDAGDAPRWPTWCVPTPTSCGSSPATARRSRGSSSSRAPIRP